MVSHGTESDPIFNYGNRKALELWELSWDDFIEMPSKNLRRKLFGKVENVFYLKLQIKDLVVIIQVFVFLVRLSGFM